MSMFTSYDNISDDYIPHNTIECIPVVHREANISAIKHLTDVCGNKIGVYWNYGDTLTLELTCKETITVDKNSYIYTLSGEGPDESVVGVINQKAYNTVDCMSWTCLGMTPDKNYNWIKDDAVLYPENGCVPIVMCPDMHEKSIEYTIFNFRWEPVHTFIESGNSEISCYIDDDLSKLMTSGVYYGVLKITGENYSKVVNKSTIAVI